MRWVSILTIRPATPFSAVMDCIHRQPPNASLRIFEREGDVKFTHGMYVADTETATKAEAADQQD